MTSPQQHGPWPRDDPTGRPNTGTSNPPPPKKPPSKTINTTDGDLAPDVFSLSSEAAQAATVIFDGGILRTDSGGYPGKIIAAPVTIRPTNGIVDTSIGSGGFSGPVSGSGSLTIEGGGTFALTAANSYAGGTLVNASTVAIANSASLGTGMLTLNGATLNALGNVTIANPAMLQGSARIATSNADQTAGSNSADSLVYLGAISGSGALFKSGATELQLGGTNTYSGGTVIESGPIGVTNDSSLGTGPATFAGGSLRAEREGITIGNAAVLDQEAVIDTRFGLTYAGSITGRGDLTKTGTGALTLSGPDTFSGNTLVAQGTLRAGSASGLSPYSAITIANGATLDVGGFASTIGSLAGAGGVRNSGSAAAVLTSGRDGRSTTFSGLVEDGTSALSIAKTGTGALMLSGPNSYSGGTYLDQGTVVVGNPTALGVGALTMANGTTLAFDGSFTLGNPVVFAAMGDPTIDTGPNDVTLSGPISGPGDLTKLGAGTLALTGLNSYTGATVITEGGLLVDGSVPNSVVTVARGATLGGYGAIGGLNLLSGGTLAPGARTTLSSLTILGNATLQQGSTYAVNVDAAGRSDRVTVGGTAALNGATLAVNGIGSGLGPNVRYAILSATGGLTGKFGPVLTSSNLAFLDSSLVYTGTGVTLGFTQAATLASVANTPNQRAVANAIDSFGPGNRLYDAVIGLDAAGARQAFRAVSGETHASTTTTAVQSTRLVSGIVFDRLWNLPLPRAGDALDALKQFEPHLPTLLQCYAPTTAPTTGLRAAPGYTVWGQAIGDFGHTSGDGNAAALDRTLGGFVLGIDSRIDARALENWRVGLAGGYTNSQFSTRSGGGSGTFENVFGTLYAGARYGAVTLRFGGTYGGTQTNARRTVAFPGFFETERSSNGGDTAQAFGEIGYRFSSSTTVIEPIFNGSYTHTHQDAYRETGGAAALIGMAQDVDVGSTVLGFRSEALPFGTVPVVARVFLGWQHTYGDINPAATLAFAAGGVAFDSYGAPLDRNAVVAEAGVDWRATPALSVGLTYFGQAGERSTDNAVKGRIEYRF